MKRFLPIIGLIAISFFSCTKGGVGDAGGSPELTFSSSDGGSQGGSGNGQAGVITAGEWNDLDHWDFWVDLQKREEFKEVLPRYKYPLNTKITVRLLSANNLPLIDEPVSLKTTAGTVLWEARTNNKGIARLFLPDNQTQNVPAFKVHVTNRSFSAAGKHTAEIQEYQVPVTTGQVTNADIAFVVDATGSMADEISYLKTELLNVISRVRSAHPDITLRTGSVFYRDEGDEYLTRKSNFSTSSNTTVDFIKAQAAAGGGDFPEAVHTALKEAVQQLTWSEKAKSKILFLVLDAPPHEDQPVLTALEAEVKAAAKKGIRIVPITASGINHLTEYLMRQIAISTNGTYVFITNHSGIGNDHLKPTVGEYEVEYLNNLMVRLINASLE